MHKLQIDARIGCNAMFIKKCAWLEMFSKWEDFDICRSKNWFIQRFQWLKLKGNRFIGDFYLFLTWPPPGHWQLPPPLLPLPILLLPPPKASPIRSTHYKPPQREFFILDHFWNHQGPKGTFWPQSILEGLHHKLMTQKTPTVQPMVKTSPTRLDHRKRIKVEICVDQVSLSLK